MDKVVTINDVAQAAGVGKGTVDRVLHNRGRVSTETRQKVLECIDALGYKPNKAARMLAKRKLYKVAVVYHNEQKEFWDQIHCGVERAREEFAILGVKVDYYLLPYIDQVCQADIINKVIEAGYDGLAIVPYCSKTIVDLLNKAIQNGMEVVTFNNREKEINCSYIGQDGYKSGQTAGKLLSMMAKKNSRYAVVSAWNRVMAQIDERCQGFQKTIKHYRSDMVLDNIYIYPEDNDVVYREIIKVLEENHKNIQAIYVTTAVTNVVAKAVSDVGLENEILIIGHDLTKTNVKYLKDGVIDILIGQEPEMQSYLAVSSICNKLLMDEEIVDVYSGIDVFVKENLIE